MLVCAARARVCFVWRAGWEVPMGQGLRSSASSCLALRDFPEWSKQIERRMVDNYPGSRMHD